jgi:hypothetical protein
MVLYTLFTLKNPWYNYPGEKIPNLVKVGVRPPLPFVSHYTKFYPTVQGLWDQTPMNRRRFFPYFFSSESSQDLQRISNAIPPNVASACAGGPMNPPANIPIASPSPPIHQANPASVMPMCLTLVPEKFD